MLYKVFDFADKEVHEVMVPRPQVVAISIALPPEEALARADESPYTRYPVYRDSLDEIVGILHVRDLFSALHDRGIAQVELEQLLRPAYIVPETKDLAALLAEFRKQNQHMAVVVDEYGAMQGIVTLEDLLEEIVGEIEDEFDLPDESVERIDDTPHPHRRHVPDRRLQRAVRHRDRGRGLPHDGRLSSSASSAARRRSATRCRSTASLCACRRGRGLADPAARGRVRRAAPRSRRRSRRSDAADRASRQDRLRRAELPRPRRGAGPDAARAADPLREVGDGADRARASRSSCPRSRHGSTTRPSWAS